MSCNLTSYYEGLDADNNYDKCYSYIYATVMIALMICTLMFILAVGYANDTTESNDDGIPLLEKVAKLKGFSLVDALQGLCLAAMIMISIVSYGMAPSYGEQAPWAEIAFSAFLLLAGCTFLLQGIKMFMKHRQKTEEMRFENIVKQPPESFNMDDCDDEASIDTQVDREFSFSSPRNAKLSNILILKPSRSTSFNWDNDDMCEGEDESVESTSRSGSRGGSRTNSATASPRTMRRTSTLEDRKKNTRVSIWDGGSKGMARSTSRSAEYARNGSDRGSGSEREDTSEGEKGERDNAGSAGRGRGRSDVDIMSDIKIGFL